MGDLVVKKITQKTPYTMAMDIEIALPRNPNPSKVKIEYSTNDLLNWNTFPYTLQNKQKEQIIDFFNDEIGYGPFNKNLLPKLQNKVKSNEFKKYIDFD